MFTIADVPTFGLFAGWILGVIFLVLTLIGLVLLIIGFTRPRYRDQSIYGGRRTIPNSDRKDFLIGGFWITLVGGVALAIVLFAMWPLKYEYHHYVTKRGTVKSINKRIISDGDGNISQRVVIQSSDGNFYGVDDTRATALRKGDTFAIKCKKEHQFFQPYDQDGFACRWGA